MWAFVSVPTDSVPTTQSPKREVGNIALWPRHAFVNHLNECEKGVVGEGVIVLEREVDGTWHLLNG